MFKLSDDFVNFWYKQILRIRLPHGVDTPSTDIILTLLLIILRLAFYLKNKYFNFNIIRITVQF